jgi:hypothetical protein
MLTDGGSYGKWDILCDKVYVVSHNYITQKVSELPLNKQKNSKALTCLFSTTLPGKKHMKTVAKLVSN